VKSIVKGKLKPPKAAHKLFKLFDVLLSLALVILLTLSSTLSYLEAN